MDPQKNAFHGGEDQPRAGRYGRAGLASTGLVETELSISIEDVTPPPATGWRIGA